MIHEQASVYIDGAPITDQTNHFTINIHLGKPMDILGKEYECDIGFRRVRNPKTSAMLQNPTLLRMRNFWKLQNGTKL